MTRIGLIHQLDAIIRSEPAQAASPARAVTFCLPGPVVPVYRLTGPSVAASAARAASLPDSGPGRRGARGLVLGGELRCDPMALGP